jgi:hypothetical protein
MIPLVIALAATLGLLALRIGGFILCTPPRRLGAQHGVMARGRGSLADATGAGALCLRLPLVPAEVFTSWKSGA